MWRETDLIKVRFLDGTELSGDTCEEVLRRLWDEAHFDTSETFEEYLRNVAEASEIYMGKKIQWDSPESLVSELHRIGVITHLERGAVH